MIENRKLVSMNILTYNGQDLIGPCLNSVLEQTYSNIEVLVVDNGSVDKTIKIVQSVKLKAQNIDFRIIENKKNLGFSAGHNIGIRKSRGEYVLCLNQDVVLDKDFVRYAVEAMEKDKKVGAVQGKLLKNQEIIDTTGLLVFKNRRIVNRGQGEKDEGQYKAGEIFGADGAAPLYRREALEDIKIPIKGSALDQRSRSALNQRLYEYFDEDFFMYKEDIDLAWRLRLYGWKAVYEPRVIAYHLRTAGERAVKNYISVALERKKLSQFAKFYSFKNQRLMQIKNELPTLFFRNFCCIVIKEIAAWLYVLLSERYSFKAIKELFRQMPRAWKKRKIIMKRKRVKVQEMKKWFV